MTGYSIFSRNRMLGNLIGRGYTIKSALNEMTMISEGYYASHTAHLLTQKIDKSFPIMEGVYQILYEKKSAKKVMVKLSEGLH